jgi:hypothetical protein
MKTASASSHHHALTAWKVGMLVLWGLLLLVGTEANSLLAPSAAMLQHVKSFTAGGVGGKFQISQKIIKVFIF